MIVEELAPRVTPKLAKRAAKSLLPKLAGEHLSDLPVALIIDTIGQCVKMYGYVKKGWIVDALKVSCPYFPQIADTFITELNDTLRLSIDTKSKRFNKISEFILNHPEISYKEKLEEYRQILDDDHRRKMEMLKAVETGVLVVTSIYTAKEITTDPNTNRTIKTAIKQKGKTDCTKVKDNGRTTRQQQKLQAKSHKK